MWWFYLYFLFLGAFSTAPYLAVFLLAKGKFRLALPIFRFYKGLGWLNSGYRYFGLQGEALYLMHTEDYFASSVIWEEEVAYWSKKRQRSPKVFVATSKAMLAICLTRQAGASERAKSLVLEALALPLHAKRRSILEAATLVVWTHCAEWEQAREQIRVSRTRSVGTSGYYLDYMESCIDANLDTPQPALDRLLEGEKAGIFPKEFQTGVTALKVHCLVDLGRIEEAEQLSLSLLSPPPETGPYRRANLLTALMRLALKKEEWDKARHYAEQASNLDPSAVNQASALTGQAEVFVGYNNPNRALQLCREVLELPVADHFKRDAAKMIAGMSESLLVREVL